MPMLSSNPNPNLLPRAAMRLARRWPWLMPLLVLLVGSALSTAGAAWLYERAKAERVTEFQGALTRVSADITQRFRHPAYGLSGLLGPFAAHPEVSRQSFRTYVNAARMDLDYPGVRGFGYIEAVPEDQLQSFSERERADGAPAFALRQLDDPVPGVRQVIRFIEPALRNLGAEGLDVASERARREGIRRALETGDATVSGVLTLVQDTTRGPGVVLFLPVADSGQADARGGRTARGLLFASIVIKELLAGLSDVNSGGFRAQLYDTASGTTHGALMYDSHPANAGIADAPKADPEGGHQAATTMLTLPGRLVTLRLSTTPDFEAQQHSELPWLFLLGGLAASLLLAALLRQQGTGRQRAEALARQMTTDLQRLALVAQRTTNAVIITHRDQGITWVNEGFERSFGQPSSDALGQRVMALLVPESDDPAAVHELTQCLDEGLNFQGELSLLRRDRERGMFSVEAQPLRDDTGLLIGYMVIAQDVSQRQQAELARLAMQRENEALLASVMTHALVSVSSPDGTILEVNEAFCSVSGYHRDELLGHSHRIINSGHHPQAFWAHMWGTITQGQPWRGQVCNRAKDGTLYWVDSIVAPLRAANGEIDRYFSLRLDISAGRRASMALADERRRLAQIIDGTGVGTWELDVTSGQLALNERWAAMLGEDLVALQSSTLDTWLQRVHPDDLAHMQQTMQQHTDGQSPRFECEMRLRHRDGHWVRVLSRGKLFAPNCDSRAHWLVGTQLDISQLKQAEADASRSGALLRGAIDAIDEAFVLFDRDDRMVFCNDKYREFYPKVAHLMVPGVHFEQLVRYGAERGEYPDAIGRVDEWVAERVAVHQQADSALIQRLDSGRTLRIVERKLPDGHIVGFRIDITELVQASEAAEQASLAKSRFLANMSHEIRTPMNAMLGMLALLKKTPLTVRQTDYTQKAAGAARSLLALLNDILDFSKVEAGKMVLEAQPFATERLLRDLAVIVSANALDKPLTLLFDIDPRLPSALVGDSLRLQQVLVNLMGNALKFTEQGEVVLSARVLDQDLKSVTVLWSVGDTGIGIAPEHQQQIFSGFAQAEASTTRRFGGTGLGLSISHRLVAMMGGDLTVESALGEGSGFSFTLAMPTARLDMLDPDSEHPAPDSAQALAQLSSDAQARRLLLVHPNAQAREVLKRMVQGLGWFVQAVANAAQALAALNQNALAGPGHADTLPLGAVLMADSLPGNEVAQLRKHLRQEPGNGLAPGLLVLASHGLDEDADNSASLVQPFTAAMLVQAVGHLRPPVARLPSAMAAAPNTLRLQGLRLLLVEDNVNNQQVACELLASEGADVVVAGDGAQAVAAIQAEEDGAMPVDAVLMDLQMPVMDGFTATGRIRGDLRRARLPIVAMTANAMASDRAACLAAGMNDHVGKPFDLDAVVRVLLRLTGRATGRNPAASTSAANAARPSQQSAPALQFSPAAAGPPAEPAVLPVLPPAVWQAAGAAGVDLASALARFMGRQPIYQRMLRRLLVELPEQPALLQSHLDRQDHRAAEMQLHGLKGSTGTLGMVGLSKTLGLAEDALRQQLAPSERAAAMAQAAHSLATAQASLQALDAALDAASPGQAGGLPSQAPGVGDAPADRALAAAAARAAPQRTTGQPCPNEPRANALLQQLEQLLARSDMQATDVVQQWRESLGPQPQASTLALEDAVSGLDFDRALALCRSMLSQGAGA